MRVKIPEIKKLKKLERVRMLRWINRISAPEVVKRSTIKFDPSYVYHIEAGRFVSRGLMVERAIAAALGMTWEEI